MKFKGVAAKPRIPERISVEALLIASPTLCRKCQSPVSIPGLDACFCDRCGDWISNSFEEEAYRNPVKAPKK